MNILGIVGGIDFLYEKNYPNEKQLISHDAAAVLINNGKVVAAIEEERLNRIKHTEKAPFYSMKFCIDTAGINLRDVDKVAVYGSEKLMNEKFKQFYLSYTNRKKYISVRDEIHKLITQAFGDDIDDNKICFVPHHIAHAESAYRMSGFEEALILTMDGEGDGISGLVINTNGTQMNILDSFAEPISLGHYYTEIITYLGYTVFDEYKVMGLAPYGDPKKFKRIFKKFYSLLPEGRYTIHREFVPLLFDVIKPRRKGEDFTQENKDVAAALQGSVEDIMLHVLKHHSEKTGLKKLCLAGGVAHNCSAVGKILYSGLFNNIFVQPAAHDAGCALGAALHVYCKENPSTPTYRVENVYWGTDIGSDNDIYQKLNDWQEFIHFEKVDKISEKTAELLTEGAVIGWVQGRSEFGPRALGNRSIIADPRPEENKDIINAMVKKREGYRPFAPSVLEDYVDEYYEIPTESKSYPFMNFVVKVKEEKQKLLGAITHVDGTARIQTVSTRENQKYAELIEEFRKKTGIPILLNTSFNNNAEPIVDSVNDAIVCYLTTKLNYLVIGNYLINKKESSFEKYLNMIIKIPLHVVLTSTRKYTSFDSVENTYEIGFNYDDRYNQKISYQMFSILQNADGNKILNDILNELDIRQGQNNIVEEVAGLWASRLIEVKPTKG